MPRRAKSSAKSARRSSPTAAISSHPPIRGAKRRGKVDDREVITATILVRRRAGGPALKDLRYFSATPPSMREKLSRSNFEERHGAAPVDLERVASFVREHELQVAEMNRSRRVVEVRGTVAKFSAAFGITFYRYDT